MMFRIVATDLPVLIGARFFAALDVCDKACWTDDAFHAQRFDTPSDAEDFARSRIGADGWKVEPLV